MSSHIPFVTIGAKRTMEYVLALGGHRSTMLDLRLEKPRQTNETGQDER